MTVAIVYVLYATKRHRRTSGGCRCVMIPSLWACRDANRRRVQYSNGSHPCFDGARLRPPGRRPLFSGCGCRIGPSPRAPRRAPAPGRPHDVGVVGHASVLCRHRPQQATDRGSHLHLLHVELQCRHRDQNSFLGANGTTPYSTQACQPAGHGHSLLVLFKP